MAELKTKCAILKDEKIEEIKTRNISKILKNLYVGSLSKMRKTGKKFDSLNHAKIMTLEQKPSTEKFKIIFIYIKLIKLHHVCDYFVILHIWVEKYDKNEALFRVKDKFDELIWALPVQWFLCFCTMW